MQRCSITDEEDQNCSTSNVAIYLRFAMQHHAPSVAPNVTSNVTSNVASLGPGRYPLFSWNKVVKEESRSTPQRNILCELFRFE